MSDGITRFEHRRTAKGIAFAVLVLGPLLGAIAAYWTGDTSEVSGLVLSVDQTGPSLAPKSAVLVRLTSGATVRASIPRTVPVGSDRAVVLAETRTHLFGLRRYRFVRYEGDPAP